MLQMNSLTDELQMNSDDTTVSSGLLYTHMPAHTHTHTHVCTHTHIVTPFPGGTDGKESACNVGDLGSIPGLGGSPGGGHDNPLQCSCLETLHGQRSLAGYIAHGVAESDMTERPSTAQHKVTPNLQTSQVSGPQPLSPFSFWCLLASPEDGVKK